MAVSAIAGLATLAGAALGGLISSPLVALGFFALGAGMSIVSRALAPKLDIGSQLRGTTATVREPAHSRKVIYGEARVGGNVVFIAHSGDDNKYLHLVVVFATHEIQSYEEIWFNDKKIWDGGTFQDGWDSYVTVDVTKKGTAGQTVATGLRDDVTEWTNSHVLSGIAYITFKLTWDQDRFPQGVPNITAVIKGKKVYDPRLDSTVSYGSGSHRVDDSSTWAYSTNPALCVRDYLTNGAAGYSNIDDIAFGLGEDPSLINLASLKEAADYCDATQQGSPAADIYSTGDKRFECSGRLETGNQIKSNIEQLLSAMGGRITYSGGEYFIQAAQYQTPSVTINESAIISTIETQTKQSRRTVYNGVKGTFISKEKNYKVLDYVSQISSTYAAEDGDPIFLDMPLPFVTNQLQAQALAKIALLKSRQQIVISMTVNLAGLKLKIGDTFYLDYDKLGYDDKVFEIIGYELALGNNGEMGVRLECIETAAAVYDWTTSDEQDFLSGGELDLYDGRTVENVTFTSSDITEIGLRGPDGGVSSSVQLVWTPPDDAFIEFFKIRYNKNGTTTYFETETREPRILLTGLEVNENYDFRIQAQNLLGVSSTGTTVSNFLLEGDQTDPGLPTGLGTTGGLRTITVTWTNPSDIDLKQIEVHVRNSSAPTPLDGDTPYAVITGEEYVYPTGQAAAVTKYFFLRAVDFSGNKSAYTSAVAGTSLQVTSEDVGDGEIEGRTLALLLNQDASGNANAGEGALVGVNIDGTVNMNADGSVLYNGTNVTIEHDQYNNYTFLTQVAGKRGYIAFDLNKTAPFQMSGSFGNINCAFVWSENDQFYYDINNTSGSGATETAFDPSSFTGTTTGTDVNDGTSTTTAHIVALGTLETTSGGDNILSGGLFPEPLDISTTQIPDDVITGRTIVVNSITANKISGDISEVFSFGVQRTPLTLSSSEQTFAEFDIPAPDADLTKYASLNATMQYTSNSPTAAYAIEVDFERKSKGTTTGTSIGTVVGSGTTSSFFYYVEVSGNVMTQLDSFGGIASSATSPSDIEEVHAVEYIQSTDRTRIHYADVAVRYTSGTIYYNPDKWTSSGAWLPYATSSRRYAIPEISSSNFLALTIHQPLAKSAAQETYRIRTKHESFSGTSVSITSINGQIELLT